MTMKTTQAARRIARAHNSRVRNGFGGNGFLVFGPDGSGRAWYSGNSIPDIRPGDVKLWVARQRRTAAQIQQWLDALAEQEVAS